VIGVSFATLAVISLVAIVGPLLAWPRRWHLPIILGELAAGIVLGATGSGRLHADNETFTFLADIGFALMALPLAIDPNHAGRAALGALAVLACAAVLFVILRHRERVGLRRRMHHLSKDRAFALELRISLAILFALAALATRMHVSIMLAGFSFGLAVAGVGEPRRLAHQLFAVTEGFLGPLFFVWLGASLDLRELGRHLSFILLGVVLGVGAAATHAAMRLTGQPLPIGALASAQLGAPVAAATVGSQLHLLEPGEPAALILGALVTIALASLSGGLAVRAGLVTAASPRSQLDHQRPAEHDGA
jgi:Kef-type K+ transport system membrane component KefB